VAIKFQFNKTFLQQLQRELKVREKALPTLQAKEAALRLEVKAAKAEVEEATEGLERLAAELEPTHRMWAEFPEGHLTIHDVTLTVKRIAGVKTPVLQGIQFKITPFSLFNRPAWVPKGIERLKQFAELRIRREIAHKKTQILEYARKKTTQKVNLYEKVQIPEYRAAILKIKRFMEDEDNLAKSSQKILKARMAEAA